MSAAKASEQSSAIKKEVLNIRNRLKYPDRKYVYNKFSKDSYERKFKYVMHDVKLQRFAEGEAGLVSDCYLLYAVCALGFTDLEGVCLFLSAMHNRNKELSIPSMLKVSPIRSRLHTLHEGGMLFRHYYELPRVATQEAEALNGTLSGSDINSVGIYCASPGAAQLVENRLGRPLATDKWLNAKPLYTVMGWASCAYVSGRIAQNKGYVDQIQGVYQTPAVGKVIIPSILKMNPADSQDVAYIGVFPAFLHLDKQVNTEEMFEKNCEYMFRRMKQFFYYHDKKEHLARMLVVVEDNSDLVQMAMRMHAFGEFKEDYDRIFFTGEGPVRMAKTSKLTHCFLRMEVDNSEQGYTFIPANPDFIQ